MSSSYTQPPPFYQWPFLPPPPPSSSKEAWYTRATPMVLFLILLVALISGVTTLVCKCFFRRWRSDPSNTTAGTNSSYEMSDVPVMAQTNVNISAVISEVDLEGGNTKE